MAKVRIRFLAALFLSGTALPAHAQLGNFEIQAKATPPQPTAIQSPRDVASGQATGIQSPRDVASGQATGIQSPRDPASGQATGRTAAPGTQPAGYLKIEGIDGESVRQAPSGQTAGTGGGANDYREGGVNDTTFARTAQPQAGAQGQASQITFTDIVISSATAPPGAPAAPPPTTCVNKNCQEFEAIRPQAAAGAQAAGAPTARGTATAESGQFIGGTGDGQGIRKPRPTNRPRKGRRMHKP